MRAFVALLLIASIVLIQAQIVINDPNPCERCFGCPTCACPVIIRPEYCPRFVKSLIVCLP